MKGLFKRAISYFMVLVMCMGMLGTTAFAATKGVSFKVDEISSDNTFEMNVTASADVEIDTVEFLLDFDNTVVEYLGASSSVFSGGTVEEDIVDTDRTGLDTILYTDSFVSLNNTVIYTLNFKLAAGKSAADLNKTTFAVSRAGSAFAEQIYVEYDGVRLQNTTEGSEVVYEYDDLSVSLTYPNSDQGIRLAAPSVNLITRDMNGLRAQIIDTVNNQSDVREYELYLYDANGNQVYKTTLTKEYLTLYWCDILLDNPNPPLNPGEYYTAKAVAIAKTNSDYADSALGEATAPVMAAYKALTFYDEEVMGLKVGVPMTPLDLHGLVYHGKPGYTFAVTEGTLPAGLKLENGVISGTPTEATTGFINVTVSVTDSNTPAATKKAIVEFWPIEKGDGKVDADVVEYNKTYGDENFTLSGFSIVPNATIYSYAVTSGDAVSVNATTGEVTILKAGTATVAVSATDDNYNAEDLTVVINVAKKAVTVKPDAATKVFGKADPSLTYKLNNVTLPNGETVVLNGVNITRAEGENVGTYAFIVNVDEINAANPNYTVSADYTNKFVITKGNAGIEVGETDAVYDVTYGDADFKLDAGLVPMTTWTYTVNNDVVTVSADGMVHINKAGTATVTVSAADDNYNVEDLTVVINVAKKAVTVTADAKSKVFGKADPALTWTTEGLVGQDTLNGITLTRASGEDAGSYAYKMTVDAAVNPNYTVTVNDTANVFTIAQTTGEVTAETTVYEKTYGDAPFSLTGFGIKTMATTTYSYDVVSGEDVVSVDADGVVTILGVGTAYIDVYAANANYSQIAPYESVKVIVEKADLEITPLVTSKTYSTPDPDLAYTVTGLVNGDTAADVLGEYLTREAGKDVGTYNFALTKEPANYNWIIEGAFEIAPLTVTAAVDADAEIVKTYDGTTAVVLPEGFLTLPGVTPEDKAGVVLNAVAVYENAYAGTKALSFTTWNLTGDDAANYKLAAAPTVMGGILPAEQTITPDSITVTTGGTVDLAAKVSASANGAMTFEADSALFTVSGSTLTAGQATGTDSLEAFAAEVDLNGDGKPEYAAADQTVTVTVKEKEEVAVTMNGASVTYDGNAHALTASVPAGFTGEWTYTYVAADEIAVVPATGAPVHAGKYTVTATFENATHFGEATATLEIKQATVTVALKLDKTTIGYGDELPAVTYTAKTGNTALANDVVTVTPDFGGAEAGVAGTYTVTATATVNDTNYTLATVIPATLEITAKAVSTLDADAVQVVGEAKQGETLAVVTELPGVEVSATWKVNGTVVATGDTYTVPYGTMGKLTCEITLGENYSGTIAKDLGEIGGMDVTAVLAIAPEEATDGTVLTAALTVTEPEGITDAGNYTVTWYADGAAFATGKTVTLTTAQLGKTIQAKAVSATGNAYAFAAESNTVAVPAKAPVITSVSASASKTSATVKVTVDEMGSPATVTATIAKKAAADTILATKEVVDGKVTFDGLEKGTEYTVVVTAENEIGTDVDSVTFKVKATSGGGGGGSSKPAKKEEPAADEKVTFEEESIDSEELKEAAAENESVEAEAGDVAVEFNEAAVKELANADAEVTVKETAEEDALAAAEVTVSKDKLAEPAEITFDLSDKDIEDPSDLTLVRLEEKADGTVEMVVLGGTYNAEEQTFTGLVTTSGTYAVVSMENLIRIRLQIDNVNAYINENLYVNDVAPVIVNGRTMVPLRFIAEAFGANLAWNEPTKTVTIVFNGQVLKLTINQPIEGFDTPAQIVNDRTMVPIRYISESFGAEVTWVPSTQTVHIVR